MKTYPETIAEIQALEGPLAEHRLPVRALHVEPDALVADERRFSLTEEGFERVCDALPRQPKIPSSYLLSLPPRVRTGLLRHHLGEGMPGNGTWSIFARDGNVVGLGRSDLARLSGPDVLDAVRVGLGAGEDDLEARFEAEGESFRCDVITHRAEHTVRRGDVVYGGVHVQHSLMGEFATKVEGYLYRLVCTNGAIHRECLGEGARQVRRTRRLPTSHPRGTVQQREQVAHLAEDAVAMVNARIQGVARLATEQVDFKHMARNWLARTRLSADRMMPLLEQAYAEEGGEGTAYDVMNAFTRVASRNRDLSPQIRERLARMGGLLAFGHSRLCSRCWSIIAGSN